VSIKNRQKEDIGNSSVPEKNGKTIGIKMPENIKFLRTIPISFPAMILAHILVLMSKKMKA